MKTSRQPMHRTVRCSAQFTLAAALLLGACSTTTPNSLTAKNSTQRHGQVKFSGKSEQIVGDITILHNADHFRAEITKGPGVPLLTITARFGADPDSKTIPERHMIAAQVTGPLAHGGWTWRPKDLTKNKKTSDKLKDPARAWGALPEVFMWGVAEAKGEAFRVCLPDVVMHASVHDGEVTRFDYTRHVNPTEGPLPLKDLKKQPVSENVICHLD